MSHVLSSDGFIINEAFVCYTWNSDILNAFLNVKKDRLSTKINNMEKPLGQN